MAIAAKDSSSTASNNNFRFCSSLADDVWHAASDPRAYEWWYFDALSDDGRDALVIIFLDNFIFSPRYNQFSSKYQTSDFKSDNGNLRTENQKSNLKANRFPGVAFCFYRDGKLLYRSINEFTHDQFTAGTDFPSCQIGPNEFQFEATPYGVRYLLNLDLKLRGQKTLKASLEWLAVEYDCLQLENPDTVGLSDAHFWNLASPRSDVTGKIEVFSLRGDVLNQIQFRGTGYHDHNFDSRWLPMAIGEWQWGRAHFEDATAVFYRSQEIEQQSAITKLFLIRDNNLIERDSSFAQNKSKQNLFGLRYPQNLEFVTEENFALTVKQTKTIDSSFFYLRFLSEMELKIGDGKTRETIGISEYLKPQSLRWRWLDWLVNMRIGRNNRGAFLP